MNKKIILMPLLILPLLNSCDTTVTITLYSTKMIFNNDGTYAKFEELEYPDIATFNYEKNHVFTIDDYKEINLYINMHGTSYYTNVSPTRAEGPRGTLDIVGYYLDLNMKRDLYSTIIDKKLTSNITVYFSFVLYE